MMKNNPGIIRALTFASILLPLLMISMIRSANAQCPPVGLLTYDDYLVATGQLTGGTVGIDQCGQFIVAYSTVDFEGTQVFARRFLPNGDPIGLSAFPITVRDTDLYDLNVQQNDQASLVMTPAGRVHVAWVTHCIECRYPHPDDCPEPPENCPEPNDADLIRQLDFPFDTPPSPLSVPIEPSDFRVNRTPSVGRADGFAGRIAWANSDSNSCPPMSDEGALHGPNRDTGALLDLCDCDDLQLECKRLRDYQPCMAMRSDGAYVVAWVDPENPLAFNSPTNIGATMFNSGGASIGTEFQVNDSASELALSDQLSPGVAIDDDGNIVVVWVGLNLDGCNFAAHVYFRRFKFDPVNGLRDPDPLAGEGPAGPFVVDNESEFAPMPLNLIDANPTVAISRDPDHVGRFIVLWNSNSTNSEVDAEVRGQYFEGDGRPMGREFRANAITGPSGFFRGDRRMTESGQHAAVYGEQDQVVVVYRSHDKSFPFPADDELRATLLPGGFAELQESLAPCNKGDVNRDGLVDGRDIQPFIGVLLSDTTCLNIVELCPPDMNNDAAVTIDDAPCFVDAVIAGLPLSCAEAAAMRGLPPGADCNGNGVADATDVFLGASEDCNNNGVPDECEIDESSTAPGGPFYCQQDCAQDLNDNGVPDDCEPDCNDNGRPDDFDIASQSSGDVNGNGVPDECESDCNTNGTPDDWDIAQATSADCNTNGSPDECEQDCNSNGVPDDCDVDPADPDGDLLVSTDCNANGNPDECDIALPPGFGSLDCNTNGIPDECDIAACESDPACEDCNANGIPDGCDIAAQISEDTNSNGIPDECESQQAQGGGGEGGGEMASMSAPGGESFFDEQAAWAEFWDWSCDITQGSNPSLSSEQKFAAMVAKLQELGLPVMNPVMAVSAP